MYSAPVVPVGRSLTRLVLSAIKQCTKCYRVPLSLLPLAAGLYTTVAYMESCPGSDSCAHCNAGGHLRGQSPLEPG